MVPALMPGQMVVGTGLFGTLKAGDVVIFDHNGLEKVKRIKEIAGSTMFVEGDNPSESTDSRQFGGVSTSAVIAKVLWPHI